MVAVAQRKGHCLNPNDPGVFGELRVPMSSLEGI
jgi:hypothetical protein